MDLQSDKRKRISHIEIIKKYRAGKREFKGIICRAGWFNNLELPDINFSNSNLSFSSFSNSNLKGSNFSNCDLRWSDLSRTNLSRSNFKNSNLSWSAIIESIVDAKTDFSNANLNYIVGFKTDIYNGKIDGIKLSNALLRITDVGSNADFALNALERSDVPEIVKKIIRKQIIEINERANNIKNLLPRSYRKNELKLNTREKEFKIRLSDSTYNRDSTYGEVTTYVPRSTYQKEGNYS
jgi:hypothetical protein